MLGVHRLPLPADPAALPGIVLHHPSPELLEYARPSPPLETLVDETLAETPNQSRWRAFHWHPVQSTYQMASATALSEALGLPPFALFLFLGLGRYFLSFLHNGLGIRK